MKAILDPWGNKIEMPKKAILIQKVNSEIDIVYAQETKQVEVLLRFIKDNSDSFSEDLDELLSVDFWLNLSCYAYRNPDGSYSCGGGGCELGACILEGGGNTTYCRCPR